MRAPLATIGVAVALSGCASSAENPRHTSGPPFACTEISTWEVPKPDGADETVAILAAGFSDGTFVPIKPLAEANGKSFSRHAKLQDFAVRAIWATWCQPGRPGPNRGFVSKVVIPFTFSRSPRPKPHLPGTVED